jgi:hypothetical protein
MTGLFGNEAKRKLCQTKRRFVRIQNGFHFLAIVLAHFAQANDLTHDFRVIALALGFALNVTNVVSDALFLFFQTLNALNEKTQLIGGDIAFGHDILPVVLVGACAPESR